MAWPKTWAYGPGSAWGASALRCTATCMCGPPPIEVPARCISHICVDLVGPLLAFRGYSFLFTIIDPTTRLVEAVPLSAMLTTNCAQDLFKGWITGFGMPAVLTSDRGSQFTSAVWHAV